MTRKIHTDGRGPDVAMTCCGDAPTLKTARTLLAVTTAGILLMSFGLTGCRQETIERTRTEDQMVMMKPGVRVAEAGKDEKPSRPPERLYGTWIAKDVDAKMGEVKIRLTFRQEKKATVLAWSDIPFVGQVRDLEGPFSVHGDTISSEAIRDGKKAKFSFESDQLVLRFKSGKVVRFDRE